MKKILSLILAGLMTVSCAAFVAADDAAVEATDPTQAYAISFLAQNGIYHGKSNEEFVAAAADPIERYQMALFVARISTGWVDDYMWDYNYDWEDNTANNSTFNDLAGTAAESYLGAISYANQKGIIEGYSATKFGPTDGITYRDALTMVVRTMGYQGLAYPWGYIEKAVELGLTEGIEGVTYTDALNRGQVAVILYNAMFAPTKSGETLAKSIFDVDFGWETIVITASDEVGFANNGKRAAAGYVGFNVVDENGKIGDKTYYVKESELALNAGHDAELAVGSLYNALFTIDGDLATLVDYDSALIAAVVNNGITDNEGVAYEKLPILATLEDYVLVKENYGKEYITFMGNEMFVYEAGVYTYYVDADHVQVGINKDTGDIVEWDETANEGKGGWKTAWYYNELLAKYYNYIFDDETDNILINWMSDKEFNEWYAKASKIAKTEAQYVLKTSFTDFGKNPYAKLSLYNADADAVAEVATYKDYQIGIFSNGTANCKVGNVNGVNHPDTAMPIYKITDLEGGNAKQNWVEAGHEKHDPNYAAGITAGNGFAWINVADDVIGFVNEDGSYNNGVVIYNWNDLTGEIEVVKYIPEKTEGTDEDSYIFTGILQAYSTKGTSITVDGEKYFYGYDALVGTTMKKGDGGFVARTLVADELDQYLMQYVKVTVVDGLVVDVDLLNQDANNVIVVYSYAGVTSDGYIAVYGYSTADGVLKIYKINSYNGWKLGDYRYYPENATIDAAFNFGTLYTIKSYDDETKSYGVETYSFDEIADAKAQATISFESGYRVIKDKDNKETSVEKAADSDCYIFVDNSGLVYVVSGKNVASNFTVTGKLLYKDGGKIVMLADVDDSTGFDLNANDYGFVLYDKDDSSVLEAAYDDAQGVEDFYLLGSTASEIRVFNLLTGKNDYVIATNNVDLEDGQVYRTVGNVILAQVDINYYGENAEFVDSIKDVYKSNSIKTAKYIVLGEDEAKEYTLKVDTSADKKGVMIGSDKIKVALAKELGAVSANATATVASKIADATIAEIRYRVVTTDTKGNITIDDITLAAPNSYTAKVVYDVATKVAVVYVYAEETVGAAVVEAIDVSKTAPVVVESWDYVEGGEPEVELRASYTASAKYDMIGGKKSLKSIVIDTLTLEYVDVLADDGENAIPCADLLKSNYSFGKKADLMYFEDSYAARVTGADWALVEYLANGADIDFVHCATCKDHITKVVINLGYEIPVEDIDDGALIEVGIIANEIATYVDFNIIADVTAGSDAAVKAEKISLTDARLITDVEVKHIAG